MVGAAVLFLLALSIARDGGGWFTAKDYAFFVLLGGLLVARYVESHEELSLKRRTKSGSRTTLRCYATVILPYGLAVWIVANLIGNHGF